jgi:hypothetical protein
MTAPVNTFDRLAWQMQGKKRLLLFVHGATDGGELFLPEVCV